MDELGGRWKEKVTPGLFSQAVSEFRNGNFAAAQQAASEYLHGLHERIHACCLKENTRNIYDVKVSVIVVSHRNWLSACEAAAGLADFLKTPGVELIFVANGLETSGAASEDYRFDARLFALPENIGGAAARNIGAYVARGTYLLFLDDDGETGPEDLLRLVQTCAEKNAIAVRGRVVPRSEKGQGAEHYDLGDKLHAAPPVTEGICVWEGDQFKKYGGFDPLLPAHEGLDLCCRMLRELAPGRFLYEPGATLRHDYAGSDEDRKKKVERLSIADRYLDYKGTQKMLTRTAFREYAKHQSG